MKKLYPIIAVLTLLSTTAKAQQTIRGWVTDEQRLPIEYANVIALSVRDSSLVTGIVTDKEGAFQLSLSTDMQVFLRVSGIGYEQRNVLLPLIADTLQLKAESDTKAIEGVTVTASRPKMAIRNDALVTTIIGSSLAKAGSGNDVLKRIPLLKGKEGSYSVIGRGAAVIYINNRKITDPTEIERLNSADIKDGEVVTNPGARDDATVGAVIRIHTVRKAGDGFGFDVRSAYYQSENVDLSERVNWKYRHKRLELFGGHGYSLDNSLEHSTTTTIVHADTLWQQDFTQKVPDKNSIFKNIIGADYQLNDSNSVGIKYMINFPHDFPLSVFISSDVTANGTFYDHINTFATCKQSHRPSQFINLYYVGKIGKMDIDFNADYLYNKQNNHTTSREESRNKTSRTVTSDNQERNRLFASKLTLGYPVLGGNLTVGAEYTYTNRNDTYSNPENYVPSSSAQLKESNIAPFMEYKHQLSICQLTAGLRWEAVRFNYYENGQHIANQSRSFSNLFPSISVATQLGDLQMQLSYAARTRRPSYSQLSNNVIYGNRFLMQSGNPLLQHEYIHDISLGAMWKFIQFGISYNDRRHAIVFWSEQNSHNSAISRLTYTNLPSIKTISTQLAFSPTIGIWTPEFTALMKKQWLTLHTSTKTYKLNKPIWQFSFNNTFDFGKGWLLAMESYLVTKGNSEISSLASNRGSLDINLTKSFLKDRLALRIGGTDLFHTQKEGGISYTESMETQYIGTYDSRQFVLTVTYKFNTSRSKYKGTGAGQAEKNRL